MATSRTPDSITTNNNINIDANNNTDLAGIQHDDEQGQNDVNEVGIFLAFGKFTVKVKVVHDAFF